MSNAASQSAAPVAIVTAAAQKRAAELCERALAAIVSLGATPSQRARGERYQIESFQNRKLSERAVCDLLCPMVGEQLIETREEAIAATDAYIAAGVAEVRRLFAAAAL